MDKLLVNIKSTSDETSNPHGSFEAILSVPTLDRDDEILDAKAFEPLPAKITIDIDHAMSVEKTIGSGQPYYDGEVLKFKGTYASHPLAQMVRSLVDEGHIDSMSVAYHQSVYEVDEKDGKRHLRKGSLLNAGIVGIPSNRDALITASKSLVADVIAGASAPIDVDATKASAAFEDVAKAAADTGTDKAAPVKINVNGALDPPRVAQQISKILDDMNTRNGKSGARHSSADMKALQTAHDALAALGVTCEQKSSEASDDTENTDTAKAATAELSAVPAPVNVNVALAQATLAEAELALLTP